MRLPAHLRFEGFWGVKQGGDGEEVGGASLFLGTLQFLGDFYED